MKKILVTGASGFIGYSVCNALSRLGKHVCGAVRNVNSLANDNMFEYISVGEIGPETNWKKALEKIDCIIHCAGKVDEINKKKDLDAYRLVNIDGTKRLAEQAASIGVKRFVFLSSIKVNGESTCEIDNNKIFTNNDIPIPKNAYSISKFEAEKVLWEVSSITGLEVVVLRLPLVYGFGVKANLLRLMKLINFGIPLPFSFIKNQRSLIGIDNLVDVLINCIDRPEANGKTFLVSDGEDLSTPHLLRHIASAMGCTVRFFPFPISLLKLLGFFIGKSSEIDRLIGSLQVDIEYTRKTLNWSPPISTKEGIRRMVQGK
jgi:nucleoside-diphosphate-sugar epimerase